MYYFIELISPVYIIILRGRFWTIPRRTKLVCCQETVTDAITEDTFPATNKHHRSKFLLCLCKSFKRDSHIKLYQLNCIDPYLKIEKIHWVALTITEIAFKISGNGRGIKAVIKLLFVNKNVHI